MTRKDYQPVEKSKNAPRGLPESETVGGGGGAVRRERTAARAATKREETVDGSTGSR